MAKVNVYDQGTNRTYTVSFDLKSSILNDGVLPLPSDFYLDVYTSMTNAAGSSFGHYVVKTLTDTAPGVVGAANDFSDLCKQYITYFINEMELLESSSSSSESSSSSSSSEGIITSSSSSSS
jgi:hypothetical protein